MGIRDYLADWVTPHDTAAGWEVGDKAITTEKMQFSDLIIPEGTEVTISSIPEARHGADPFALGSVSYTDPDTGKEYKWLECALSDESGDHHFGGPAGVRRP